MRVRARISLSSCVLPSFIFFSLTSPLHAHLEVCSYSKFCSFLFLTLLFSLSSHLWISFLPPFTSNLGSQFTPISFRMCVLSVQMLSNANCDPLSSSHLLPPSILFTFSSFSSNISLHPFFLCVYDRKDEHTNIYIYILGGTEGATKKRRCDKQDWEIRKGIEREREREKEKDFEREEGKVCVCERERENKRGGHKMNKTTARRRI